MMKTTIQSIASSFAITLLIACNNSSGEKKAGTALMAESHSEATSPKLTKLTASFHTTNEDKDWNSSPGVQILLNEHTIGELFCCSSDRPKPHDTSCNGDHWCDNSDSPALNIPISEAITKDELDGATYRVSLKAQGGGGNDKWQFDGRLHADFDDNSQRNWTFISLELRSSGGNRPIIDRALSGGHD